MDYKKKTKKALPYSMAISVLKVLIALLGMKYLVDYLEGVEYAALGLLVSFPKISNMITSVGYDAYLTRYLPKIEDDKEAGNVAWNIMIQRLAIISIICLLLFYLPEILSSRSNTLADYSVHIQVYSAIVFCRVGMIYLRFALNARFMQKQIFWLDLLYQLVRLSAILYILFNEGSFLELVILFACCEAMYFVTSAATFSSFNNWPTLSNIFWKRTESKEEIEYRRISYLNAWGVNFQGSDIAKWVLEGFSNSMQVGIYTLTTQILKKILDFYPLRMLRPLAEPAMYGKYDEKKDGSALNKMFQFFFNANNIFGFLVLAIFIPLGTDFLDMFFKRTYTLETYWPLVIFMFFLVFWSIPLGIVVKAIERPKILLWAKLSVFANLGIGIPMAYYYGAVGMAFAAALSVVLKNAIMYVLARKHTELQIPWMSTVKSLVNTAVTVVAIYGFKALGIFELYVGSVNIGLFILAGIGVVVYMGVSKFNTIFSLAERELLFSLIPKKAKGLANKIL